MSVRLLVVGAAGRMVQGIISIAAGSDDFELVGAVEYAGSEVIGADAGVLAGVGELGVLVSSEYASGADVVIDFSLPGAAVKTIEYCVEQKCGLVIGTTGLDAGQRKKVLAASDICPVIYGTNMSVGMNVLFSLVGKAAAMLGADYDVEIVEQHHRFKKDVPSGSAITLAEKVCQGRGVEYGDAVVVGRGSDNAERSEGQIGIHSVRAGDITGVHDVMFSTLGETVTLSHRAHNRDGFANGALLAAKWLCGKGAGIYTMADVLGIK